MNDYRKKSDAELRYIIKDAGEAVQAMRDIDRNAECKYLDQVNDACTELHRRGKNEQGSRDLSIHAVVCQGSN